MADGAPPLPAAPSGIRVPRAALWGAFALITFTVGAIVTARDTGVGTLETPRIAAAESRELVFRAVSRSGMEVLGANSHRLANLIVEGDSFVMAAVRALAAQRPDDPVALGYHLRLRRSPAGGLELADPQTGRKLTLAGFGPDNLRAFSVWLDEDRG